MKFNLCDSNANLRHEKVSERIFIVCSVHRSVARVDVTSEEEYSNVTFLRGFS